MKVAGGQIIGTCRNQHRHQEWLRCLNWVRKSTPGKRDVHLICDHDATHQHDKVKAWQRRNPRFPFHFPPTSASWLNMVESFFRDLTVNSLRRGVFRSVAELIEAIQEHVAAHHANPAPFVWTATASDILAKCEACAQKTS